MAPSPLLFALLVVFIALEFLRPPLLQTLRIQTVLLVVFPLAWLASSRRPWSTNLTLLVLFTLAGAVMLPFALNYFEVYMNLRLMFGMWVIALTTTWLLAERTAFKRVVWIWVGMMVFEALWALTHEGHGYGAALGDENDLALGCGMAFPFAFVGLRFLQGRARWLAGLAAFLLGVGIVASWSRGGFLGLIAAAGYSLFAVGRHRARNLAIGCAVAGVFYLAVPSSYVEEMGTIKDTREGTAETRFYLWATATLIWLDHPILGAGPQNATFLLGRYQPPPTEGGMFSSPAFTDRNWSMTAIHSVYFQCLSERGLVGVALFTSMGVLFYVGLRRLRRDVARARGLPRDLQRDAFVYALALESAMAGFLIAGAFLSMLYYTYFWFFTALAVAHERAIRGELAARPPRERARSDEVERPDAGDASLGRALRGVPGHET